MIVASICGADLEATSDAYPNTMGFHQLELPAVVVHIRMICEIGQEVLHETRSEFRVIV